ncbi:tryptophan synthase beta subunit-like PLP-dependent enzyme [Massariosphaeria phaeospora]|uniref:Tryptophan synthase beta subunit-like PLP-dependent enzyme n=1 Tax=Massariosphaeria phaeospora TaxID=100035 RepID=A0A7C8M5I5_9PLEO|nr:tryptophan synthase beta subunit-like PLP-dependent enzyme [Massariosphaeria phaeospora]
MAAARVPLPRPFADIKRVALMYPQATHIEPLNNLTKHIVGEKKGPKLWIKHEDTNSPLAYGGNKVRKFEYVIADALEIGATHLVTVGGVQSNSQRQVVAAGNRYRLKVGYIWEKSGSPYDTAGNVQIGAILGASWVPSTPADKERASATDGIAYEVAAFREMDRLKAEGHIPYFIPSGASLHPLGGLGFARLAFELELQEADMGVRWDTIVVACASGSTLGGIAAGFKLIERERGRVSGNTSSRRLIGIQATSCGLEETERVVLKSAKNTAKLIGLQEDDVTKDDFELVGRFNGGAYGWLDDKTREGIKLLAGTEGILTDPVYTGKAITGLITLVREGAFGESENVLFIHTGGTAAIGAYPSMR